MAKERHREKERKRDRKGETLNHLSIHQWVRSAIFASHQLTSPIGFPFLKLPPPPCAVLLVYIHDMYKCTWIKYVMSFHQKHSQTLCRKASPYQYPFGSFGFELMKGRQSTILYSTLSKSRSGSMTAFAGAKCHFLRRRLPGSWLAQVGCI